MYVIREWFKRYEVSDKGQPARQGDRLRVKSPPYIRAKNRGRTIGAGFEALQRIAGDRAYEVVGIFGKLLEIAADSGPDVRGILLNHKDDPADIDDLAHILRISREKSEYAIQVLTDSKLMWVLQIEPAQYKNCWTGRCQIPKNSGKTGRKDCDNRVKNGSRPQVPNTAEVTSDAKSEDGTISQFPDFSDPLYNETKRNETEHNLTKRKGSRKMAGNEPSQKAQSGGSGLSQRLARASISLRFVDACQRELKTVSKSDRKAVANLGQWLDQQVVAGRLEDVVFDQVMQIAAAAMCGESRNRFAVFFSKLDEDLGYRPRVIRDKQK